MTKTAAIIAVLAAVNVCSAMAVIYMKHLSRQHFVEISEQQAAIDDLDVRWSQLQIEESTFSEHGLVERVANDRLDMVFPNLTETVMVTR